MHALAQEHPGGVCLSRRYVGSNTKLRWRCAEGHEWEATPSSVKNNDTWCPECGNTKLTIEQMQALAKKHDGVCLSTVYVNNQTKLRWRCAEEHEWQARSNDVKNLGNWCPECAGNSRGTIEQMQALAKEKNGVCVSTVYVNTLTKLRWRCAEGHEWDATPRAMNRRVNWCTKCPRVAQRRAPA